MGTTFKDRVCAHPYRKKLTIISQTPTEIIADIERADAVQEDGTPINASVFNAWDEKVENACDCANASLAKVTAIENKIYPVGSVYISASDNVTPAQLFGGTWVQITDAFILASSDKTLPAGKRKFPLGAVGGEISHALSVNEMPSHIHSTDYTSGASVGSNVGLRLSSMPWTADIGTYDVTYATGSGQPHNNMPPYTTLNVWWRQA